MFIEGREGKGRDGIGELWITMEWEIKRAVVDNQEVASQMEFITVCLGLALTEKS